MTFFDSMATIQCWASKIQRASYKIVYLVKDYRTQRVGGFDTVLLLWEGFAVPLLLYNCSTWHSMRKKEEKAMAGCQFFFLCLVLSARPGAPSMRFKRPWGLRVFY